MDDAIRQRLTELIQDRTICVTGGTGSIGSELVRQLESTTAPRTCPHGRPTMIHFSASQLAREFGRI